MRLSIPTLLGVIFVYSLLLGIIFFFLDKYLDMRVISYSVDMTRQAMNLLNTIMNSLSKEGLLVIDKEKLSSKNIFRYDIPEYDYNLTVKCIDGKVYRFQKNIDAFDFTSGCYLPYQVMKGYAELPVIIKDGNKRIPAKARLELVRTPISELAFWISQGSFRVKEGFDKEVVKLVRADFKEVYLDSDNRICMTNYGKPTACKEFNSHGKQVILCGGNLCRGWGECITLKVVANETGIFINKVRKNE